jgi:putative oxidoreductase
MFPSATTYDNDTRSHAHVGAAGRIYNDWAPRLLSVLRIVTGFLFIAHGTQKMLGFPAGPEMRQPELMSLPGLAGVLELFGGALILVGLFTRPVAFVLSGLMAFAYFMAHAPQGFWPILNRGELAVLYCFVFLYLSAAGGGEWSLDRLFHRSRT